LLFGACALSCLRSKQLFDQGQALYAQQKYRNLLRPSRRRSLWPRDKNLVIVLAHEAEAYGKAKEYDKAIATYQRAIQLSPADASLYDGLGTVYIDQRKIPEAQAGLSEKAAEVNPAGADGSTTIWRHHVNSGKMDEALQALKKATDIDANNANAWYWYGMALLGKAQFKPDGSVEAVPVPWKLSRSIAA